MNKKNDEVMDSAFIIEIIDSLYLAKKALQVMPQLPKHMKPSHIRVLHVVYIKAKEGRSVRVSDVSADLGITKPSITKLIHELIDLGAVIKTCSAEDKRVVYVELTGFGRACVESYVVDYHEKLSKVLGQLDYNQYRSMIDTMEYLYESMEQVSKQILPVQQDKTKG